MHLIARTEIRRYFCLKVVKPKLLASICYRSSHIFRVRKAAVVAFRPDAGEEGVYEECRAWDARARRGRCSKATAAPSRTAVRDKRQAVHALERVLSTRLSV